MEIPRDLGDQLAALFGKVAELERRIAGQKRTGEVVAIDPASGRYRVRLRAAGSDGRPVLSPWVPLAEAAAGDIRDHNPCAVGEQVVLTSESGELADAEITARLPSDAKPRPDDRPGVRVIEVGQTRVEISAEGVLIKAPLIRLEATDAVIAQAPKIVTDGATHLGGEGGKLAIRADDLDTAADRSLPTTTKVFIK